MATRRLTGPAETAVDDAPVEGAVELQVRTVAPSGWWVLMTPLLPWLVALPAGKWLLPLLAPMTMFPAFIARVRERRYGAAWGLAMAWAGLLSAGVIMLVGVRPGLAAAGILHGEPYRIEMFGWIANGVGKEVMPAQFVPEHFLHLGVFLVLTVLSGGYLGLVLGAYLTVYMSYFVGSFAAAAESPLMGALAAWVPWSVVRVAAFVLFGALLSRPLWVGRPWGTERRFAFGRREAFLLALAAAGIGADLLIKIHLAPSYGVFLRGLLR